MEYSPWAKINKSPKEKQALIDAPVPMAVHSLYTKEYAKKAKTIHQSKDAEQNAYDVVGKKHGKETLEKLKAYHQANLRGEDSVGMKRGGSANKKHANW